MTITYTTQNGVQGTFSADYMRLIETGNQRQVRKLFSYVVKFADDLQTVTAKMLIDIMDRLSVLYTDLEITKASGKEPTKREEQIIKRFELAEQLCRKGVLA